MIGIGDTRLRPCGICHDRIDHVPRGKMLGGCHSHNASAWVRGHRSDFERWEQHGCSGWGWPEAQRLYRKIEDWRGPPCELRGVGGPLYVAPPVNPNPIAAAFVAAAASVGLPIIDDHNGPEMEGTSFFNLTIRDGQRFSVARGYLKPAMNRSNTDGDHRRRNGAAGAGRNALCPASCTAATASSTRCERSAK